MMKGGLVREGGGGRGRVQVLVVVALCVWVGVGHGCEEVRCQECVGCQRSNMNTDHSNVHGCTHFKQ